MAVNKLIAEWNARAARDDARLLRNGIDAVGPADVVKASFLSGFEHWRMRHLRGMSAVAGENAAVALRRRVAEAVSGLAAGRGRPMEFAFAMCSDGRQTAFYFGAPASDAALVTAALDGALEDAAWDEADAPSVNIWNMGSEASARLYGGVITGMPGLPEPDSEYRGPLSTVAPGMQGRPFAVLCLCRQQSAARVREQLDELGRVLSETDQILNVQLNATESDRRTENFTMFGVKRYMERLQLMERHLLDSEQNGAWLAEVAYGAVNASDGTRLGALLRAGLGGPGSGPEPVRAVPLNEAAAAFSGRCFAPSRDITNLLLPPRALSAMERRERWGEETGRGELITQLSSDQLAGLLMLPEQETSGFFVNDRVSFDVTARAVPRDIPALELGDVCRSVYSDRAVDRYRFPRPDLDRHALVVGATGGGKSNTIRALLRKLWAVRIPFMVIESAKSEYWQLARLEGFDELCALQLGDVNSPFRLNPFECAPGFPLQTHVDSLLATFNAAFEMYPPMPYILEQAVYRVYKMYGWNVATGENRAHDNRFPTLSDLFLEIPRVVAGTAYDREIKNNVQGALQTRVRSLMVGGKGKMMDVRRSTPIDRLLRLPLVLELESLGDDSVKAFCIGLLMNRLYEYRRSKSDGTAIPFGHLLVIEEAHRLLKNLPETTAGGNPQAAAVAFFCNMLAEIRSYGQGILIADQSPAKLAPDAIRNTNLKLVHRMVDANDRQAVGSAMHMNEAQIEALTMLRRGCAATYAEGDHRPRLVQMELVKYARGVTRARVLEDSRKRLESGVPALYAGDTAACRHCPHFNGSYCASGIHARSYRSIAAALTADMRRVAVDALEDNGPNSELIHQIVLAAIRCYGRGEGVPEAPISAEDAARLLCIAGWSLARLDAVSPDAQDVGMVHYARQLRARTRH